MAEKLHDSQLGQTEIHKRGMGNNKQRVERNIKDKNRR